MEISVDSTMTDEPGRLPEHIAGIPQEIETLKSEQADRAAQTSRRRQELEARLAQLAELERHSKDFTGTSPAEVFGEDGQQLCDEFLAHMKEDGYRLSVAIVSAEKTRRKQPQVWRAYPVGRAWAGEAGDQNQPYITVYLTDDGRLRTGSGGSLPPSFQVTAGKTVSEKWVSFADDWSDSELINLRRWVSLPLADKLSGISRQADLSRMALS